MSASLRSSEAATALVGALLALVTRAAPSVWFIEPKDARGAASLPEPRALPEGVAAYGPAAQGVRGTWP